LERRRYSGIGKQTHTLVLSRNRAKVKRNISSQELRRHNCSLLMFAGLAAKSDTPLAPCRHVRNQTRVSGSEHLGETGLDLLNPDGPKSQLEKILLLTFYTSLTYAPTERR